MSRHQRISPRDAMLLYRQERLREEEEQALLLSQGPVSPEGKQPPPNELGTQEKMYDRVGRQDAVTSKNRKTWKAQIASLEDDLSSDAAAMAALYARLPGHHLPVPGNVASTMTSIAKDQRIQRRRVSHKTGAHHPGANKGSGLLLPHLGSLRKKDGSPLSTKGNVPSRTHVPVQGSIAIV